MSKKSSTSSVKATSEKSVKADTDRRIKAFLDIFGDHSANFDPNTYLAKRFLDHFIVTHVTPGLIQHIREAEAILKEGAEFLGIDYEIKFSPEKFALETTKKVSKKKKKNEDDEKKEEPKKKAEPSRKPLKALLTWHASLRSSVGVIIGGLMNEFHLVAELIKDKQISSFDEHLANLDKAAGEFYDDPDAEDLFPFMQICRPFLSKQDEPWDKAAHVSNQFTKATTSLFGSNLVCRAAEAISLVLEELTQLFADKILYQPENRRAIAARDVMEFFVSQLKNDKERKRIFIGVMAVRIGKFCKVFEPNRQKKDGEKGKKGKKEKKSSKKDEDSKSSDEESEDSDPKKVDSSDEEEEVPAAKPKSKAKSKAKQVDSSDEEEEEDETPAPQTKSKEAESSDEEEGESEDEESEDEAAKPKAGKQKLDPQESSDEEDDDGESDDSESDDK
jgi:hypothetical protein